MTQDQCVDNGQQATSNNHFTNDQVSDDLNNSKNNILSNSVSSVQEFNVDVNSKRSEDSTDVAIVQNCSIDADSPSAGKVSTSNDTKENLHNLVIATDVNKSEDTNNILVSNNMTVIKHQNSNENIRDIIANSDQVNKIPSESQLSGVDENVNSEKNPANGNDINKSGAIKKELKSSKSELINDECEKPEDPIVRLNKLRASISNALSEVKGVLKQYSTEQSLDGENESTQLSQPIDNGPVRFRFVRKIRRRSVFNEDDNAKVPRENIKEVKLESGDAEKSIIVHGASQSSENHFTQISADFKDDKKQIVSTIAEEKKADGLPIRTKEKNINPLKDNHDVIFKISDESSAKSSDSIPQISKSTQDKAEAQHLKDTCLINSELTPHVDKNGIPASIERNNPASVSLQQNINTIAVGKIKPIEASIDVVSNRKNHILSRQDASENPSNTASTKAKLVKTKKVVKKDRRASIAAVEINKVLTESSSPQLELKIQRRPSDSGTLVKQPARIKAKAGQKTKLPAQHQSKTDVPIASGTKFLPRKLSQSPKEGVKIVTPDKSVESIQPKSKLSSSNITKIEIPKATGTNVALPSQLNQSRKDDVNAIIPDKSKESMQPMSNVCTIASPHQETPVIENEVLVVTEENIAVPQISHLQHENVNTSTATSDKRKESTQTKSNLLIKTAVGISATHTGESAVKAETSSMTLNVNTTKTNSPRNQSNDGPQTKTTRIEQETVVVNTPEQNAGSAEKVVNTVSLPEVKKNQNDKVPQKPEVTVVPTPIQSSEVCVGSKVLIMPSNDSKDIVSNNNITVDQKNVTEQMDLLAQEEKSIPDVPAVTLKKKRKAKRKVVIRRIKRKLSREDAFFQTQEAPAELEICEKEIEEKDVDDVEPEDEAEIGPKHHKPCLKARQFEIGDVVMYAEHYKKTQVKWRKGVVIERITSISYKLDIDGEERPAHISYIKKFTDRKVNFGGKEYLEIDYAQIEEEEEEERNYSIWNLV